MPKRTRASFTEKKKDYKKECIVEVCVKEEAMEAYLQQFEMITSNIFQLEIKIAL